MKAQQSVVFTGAKRRLYFGNYPETMAGRILHGSSSVPVRKNNWWNTRQLLSYPYYVLVMVRQEGAGFYRNERGFECQLEYGHFFLALPHFKQRHGPGMNDYWSDLSVGFAGPIFDLQREIGVFNPDCLVWKLEDTEPWLNRYRQILEAPRPDTVLGVTREAVSFLAFLLEMLEQAQPVNRNAPLSDWFQHACLLLTKDLTEKADMHDIAQEMGMSYNSFRHHFTLRAGKPPGQYRDEKRMESACAFLKDTRKHCKEIAQYLGYSSEQHFSARFKEWHGLSPREYRKKYSDDS